MPEKIPVKTTHKYKISALWVNNSSWIVPNTGVGLVSFPGAHGYKQ